MNPDPNKTKQDEPKIHAFIISWEGYREKAQKIAASIKDIVSFVTVVYSNRDNVGENGPGEWIQVPNEYFYGLKFRECLRRFRGDIMLQIQADAASDDWGSVIRSLKSCYSNIPRLEIWCPEVDYSFWNTEMVSIGMWAKLPGVNLVLHSDGVVWSLTKRAVKRLEHLDFEINNFGWGIELAAICFAFSNGMLAVRDTNIKINHPIGTGYDTRLAGQQRALFYKQLTACEKIQLALIMTYVNTKGADQTL